MTALALSELVAVRDPITACIFLKPYLESDLRMAHRYASRRILADEIAAIDLADYGA